MQHSTLYRLTAVRKALLATMATVVAASSLAIAAPGAGAHVRKASVKPTVVLVHGAFADASSWDGEITRLQRDGYTVLAPANPLRGVTYDTAYLRDVLKTISGPIVLVGHSYGGFVISNAATGNPNVKALVYIAAYAPDEGETIESIEQQAPGGMIGPETLDIQPYPKENGTEAPEAYIKPAVFHQIFANDLPISVSNALSARQRPAALGSLGEPSGPPAWKTIRSWYLVPGADHAIGSAVERIMAHRIHATTVEVKGASHVVMISHPEVTTRLILAAAHLVA